MGRGRKGRGRGWWGEGWVMDWVCFDGVSAEDPEMLCGLAILDPLRLAIGQRITTVSAVHDPHPHRPQSPFNTPRPSTSSPPPFSRHQALTTPIHQFNHTQARPARPT